MLTPQRHDDPIIQAVIGLNAGYNNSDYAKRTPERLGDGNLYTVVFRGENREWLENYVFERGGKVKPYWTIQDFLRDSTNGLIPSSRNPDLIKLWVISALTMIFAIPVVAIVIWDHNNKSLQVLTGLLGLTIGYLVGKGDPPQPRI